VRIIWLRAAAKFHTCSLNCIFVHAHVAAKNDLIFFRRAGGELCEAFEILCCSGISILKTVYFCKKGLQFGKYAL